MKKSIFFNLLFYFINICFLTAQTSTSAYKVTGRISIEGDGGWDYLVADNITGKLFVSHSTMVQVLDLKTNKLIATIPDTKGVHGIAIASDLQKGFISNGRDSSVTVFDLNTLKTINKVYVTGRNPDAILFDLFSQRVFVFNGRTSNSTVIDARTDKVIETIQLDGKPEFAVSDKQGKIYVNIEDKSEISVINSISMKVEQTWSIKPGQEPSGLAIDIVNHRLFSVCDNRHMIILDALSGKIITTIPIGDHVDGCAFDPDLKRIYSSNGDGTLTVVQQESKDSYKVIENVPTQKGARTISVDVNTHCVYLPTAEYGPVPEPTNENPHPRPSINPGSFVILVVEPTK